MYRFFIISVVLASAAACTQVTQQPQTTIQSVQYKSLRDCSVSPIVFDKEKILIMLKNNGTITPDMNDEQIRLTVDEFIQNKRKVNKDCQ